MNLFYLSYFIGGGMLMMTLVGLVVSAILPVLEQWIKRFFIILFAILSLTLVALIGDLSVFDNPNLAAAERAALFFECLFISLLSVMPTVYLLHSGEKKWRSSPLLYIILALWSAFFIMLLITQFTTVFYYVTPNNRFFRGPWFPALLIPVVLICLVSLAAVIRKRKLLSRKMYVALLIYLIPLSAGMVLHMFVDAFEIVDLSLFLSTVVMFSVILSEQIDQYRRQQREIARQQANILLLQMRPHFIYNSLTSIYYLCEQNPKKAQQVIMDFTTYLRKNFSAVSNEATIAFPEELAHTKAYLAVEKAQHDDLLFIDYDTPHTLFRLPPLTLQPIVENAIKHGLDPDGEPLHISIQTCKTASGAKIIVENNGIGFDPNNQSKTYSALTNIKQRLAMMCNGTITISPRKEGGTIVTVKIPSS